MQPKRVFLSYAWESDEFRVWVKQFATRLRADGVDARLDEWHLADTDSIPEFMNREVRQADWVLVLCSPAYRSKVHGTEDGVRVAGVGWETRLLSGRLFVGNENKVLAVLARGEWARAAPDFLLSQKYFDLSQPAIFEKNYAGLLRGITGSREKAPPLGALPGGLDAAPVEPLRYARTQTINFARHAPAALALALAIDLAIAGFVRSALPYAGSFGYYLMRFFPLALVVAVGLIWIRNLMPLRARPEKG